MISNHSMGAQQMPEDQTTTHDIEREKQTQVQEEAVPQKKQGKPNKKSSKKAKQH